MINLMIKTTNGNLEATEVDTIEEGMQIIKDTDNVSYWTLYWMSEEERKHLNIEEVNTKLRKNKTH